MKQAVILAAGEGQRLRPFTVTKSKVMLTIADKPILQYVIEALAQSGIRNILLVVGYRKQQIFDYFGSGEKFGVEINYVVQERQLGTAHALAQTRTIVADEFLVLPGDLLIEASTLTGIMEVKPQAVMVRRVDNPTRYGVVAIDGDVVKNIVEKPQEARTNIVSTSIYAFTREIFDFVEPELDIPDVLNKMIAEGYRITARELHGTWLDVVYPWDMLSLNNAVLQNIKPSLGGTIEKGVAVDGLVSVGEGTVIRSGSCISGPVVIGKGCKIGPHVCIFSATTIGDNVVVSPFTEIENSVIGADVHIGPGCIIQDSIIDKGCVIKGHFTACSDESEVKIDDEHHLVNVGAMLGESCHLSSGIVAQPGVILGNSSQVHALKMISGRLPDRSLVF